MSTNGTIKRRFADLPWGQMHYRTAGSGPTLLMLHASPGSSRQIEPLIGAFARTHTVVAPDHPGFGDSAPMPNAAPTIADYAVTIRELMDAIGIDKADVYGSHTGASVAAELAIAEPGRVRRVVQDGAGVFTADEAAEFLEHYAHPFTPDLEGTQLLRAFMFCRDQYLFFPWYARTRAKRRDSGLGPAEGLHAWVVEVLKAATTYHLGYRAAFAWPAEERQPLVTQPTLCMAAEDDPLREGTKRIAPLMPNARFEALPRYDDPHYGERLVGAVTAFLSAQSATV